MSNCLWPIPLLVTAAFASGCRHPSPNLAVAGAPTVEEVRLDGFDPLSAADLQDLRDRLSLRPGVALTDEAETAAGNEAIVALQNRGHPYAEVRLERRLGGNNRAVVAISAVPGTFGYFGPIDIIGNRRVEDAIIRRRLAFAPGDPFSRRAIERSQQRLGALGLFKSVSVALRDVDLRPAEVPTMVTVEERSPWRWNLSLGYATGENVSLGAQIAHLNFLGAARRLDVEGSISSIEHQAGAALTQTDTWHPSLSFSLQVRDRALDEHAFFVSSRGGQAAARWQWTSELASTASFASALERSQVDESLEPLIGLQDGMLNAWSIDVDHRVPAPDAGLPPVGALALHVEQAGGWMPGTFNYVSLVGDVRRYHRIFDDAVVLAARVRYGSISPQTDDADIPLLKRFFMGGSEEMRGWGRYEVSPLSDTGEAVGGKSLLSLTAEIRYPIMRRLRGVVFVEAGNVWQDAWPAHPGSLLYDTGPGVRVDTPFGMLRLDLGYQLKRLDGLRIDGEPEKHRWRLSFGIGEAF